MQISYFGDINLTNLEENYESKIEFKGKEISIDLNFEEKTIDEKQLQPVIDVLSNLEKTVKEVQKYIHDDFENGEEVEEFIEYHLEELEADELEKLLENADKNLSKEQQLLSVVNLSRIGFYPEGDDVCVFDFMLNEEISNYILVVNLDADLNLADITMES